MGSYIPFLISAKWKFIEQLLPYISVGGIHESESRSVVSDSLRPRGLYNPRNSPGQNTGVGSLFLLQSIFPTQESNRDLLHCRQILYQRAMREEYVVPCPTSPTQGTWVWAALGVGDGQGSLVCCNPWGREESDATERLNQTELKFEFILLDAYLLSQNCIRGVSLVAQ